MTEIDFKRALQQFDALAFTRKHGGYKESANKYAREYLLPCPWCASSRLRWHHPGKNGFKCWGCNKQGSSLELIVALEGLTYQGAMAFVKAGYVGGDADLTLKGVPEKAARTIGPMDWPRGVEMLAPVAMHEVCWKYLAKRGVDAATAAEWQLGFGRSGKLANYVVFPVFQNGMLLYWQARACWDPPPGLSPEDRRGWVKLTEYVKSINPPMRLGHAVAGDVLLNYDRARHFDHVVVVEGPFDAIKVGPYAVALLGKVPTEAKISALLGTAAKRITIYLDRGEEEARCGLQLAQALAPYRAVFIAQPPENKDAGDLTVEENWATVCGAVPFAGKALAGVAL